MYEDLYAFSYHNIFKIFDLHQVDKKCNSRWCGRAQSVEVFALGATRGRASCKKPSTKVYGPGSILIFPSSFPTSNALKRVTSCAGVDTSPAAVVAGVLSCPIFFSEISLSTRYGCSQFHMPLLPLIGRLMAGFEFIAAVLIFFWSSIQLSGSNCLLMS